MTKSDGRRSAQGNRLKPSFEYQPIPNEEGKPGQSEKDLGARWGLGERAGPRMARKRLPTPEPPGGLGAGTIPEGMGSRRASLDQPIMGSDRLLKPSLDQALKASDWPVGLDQSLKDDSDWPRGSLDQSWGGDSDQLESQRDSGERRDGVADDEVNPDGDKKNPGDNSEELEYADSQEDQFDDGNRGSDGDSSSSDEDNTIGPSKAKYPWKKVFHKSSKNDVGSDGSRDVENLLDRPDSRDGSKYFPKDFHESDEEEQDEPEPEHEESDFDARLKSELAKILKKRDKDKLKKKRRKGKEPVRPKGFDTFMSSISQAGGSGARNPAAEALSSISVRHDERNVPSGVHFNRKSIYPNNRSKTKEPEENPKSSKSVQKSRKRSQSTSSSSSLSTSSSDSSSSSSSPESSPKGSSSSSPSSSSASESSSDSTSSTSSQNGDGAAKKKKKKKKKSANKKRRPLLRREREEKMLKRVKIDAPSQYNGKADLDVFDRWAFEVKTWKRLNRLSDEIAITMLNKYVTDKAGVFYMKYVAEKAKMWTMTAIFEGLFDYCFPKDFKSNLRRKLMAATQGKSRITEFIRDIELMADRFPDVNSRGIIDIFWGGMHQAIRVEVLKMGAHPERSDLTTIADCAARAEDGLLEAELQKQKDGVQTVCGGLGRR
ncbi:hypothetical protein BJ322DRAFT_1020915 [Thelephora terrestris]|uniref:Retrotransposon gag domain-containing protein n=1 Tax=Thelephora terrestris TaxID=56493 RepID=A0A9P6L710_9AGAM|nr:hypothetical protein BJ322DRAFT_1020915 [Thelephora terrestris]